LFLLETAYLSSYIAGATGYQLIEGWSFFDGLYMTVITVASVGYGETHPLSDAGRIFTIFLILTGSGILLYSISMITAIFVEGTIVTLAHPRIASAGAGARLCVGQRGHPVYVDGSVRRLWLDGGSGQHHRPQDIAHAQTVYTLEI